MNQEGELLDLLRRLVVATERLAGIQPPRAVELDEQRQAAARLLVTAAWDLQGGRQWTAASLLASLDRFGQHRELRLALDDLGIMTAAGLGRLLRDVEAARHVHEGRTIVGAGSRSGTRLWRIRCVGTDPHMSPP